MILISALPMAQGADLSPLPVLLPSFNLSNICVYDLKLTCGQSHRGAS